MKLLQSNARGSSILAHWFALAAIAWLCYAKPAHAEEIIIASWNIENLFDWHKSELTPDETVAKESATRVKLRKRAEIIKLIKPDILCLGEIENRFLLRLLCEEYLKDEGYNYYTLVEEKSPRGIDVGMIAKRPFFAQSFSVPGFDRGILAARFVIAGEPVYVLANHWKSRLGGGQDLRMNCANTVLDIADRIVPEYEGRAVAVIVAGDLNDEPKDPPVKHLIEAGMVDAFAPVPADQRWTIVYYYRDRGVVAYEAFDHFIYRAPASAPRFIWKEARVEYPPRMLTKRTIEGKQYVWPDRDIGNHLGYSDHMPIVGKFEIKEAVAK